MIGLRKPEKTKKEKASPKRDGLFPDGRGFIAGYFMPLGLNIGDDRQPQYYFLSNTMKSIVKFPASKLVRQNLLILAPLEIWSANFSNSNGGIDNMAAADFLISISQAVGYFEEGSIRGRGMWEDDGKFVFHAGDCLLINGQRSDLASESAYVYELRGKIRVSDKILQPQDTKKLVEILVGLNWENKAAGRLLAGWLMIAPICGVLKWRPHLWITGSKNSGKSWVLSSICAKILEGVCGFAQGNTSESGIRQWFNGDALPFLLDEAEGDTERRVIAMQEIMGLPRAGSTGEAPPPMKGSKEGKSVSFPIRSCFLFSSIVPQIKNDNDKRRFTVFGISKLKNDSLFKRIAADRKALLTKEYCQRWQMRSIQMVESILESIDIFVECITELTSARELADQLAPMLAGYYHTSRNEVATYDEAMAFSTVILEYMGLDSESSHIEVTDEEGCLQLILSREEKIEATDIEGRKTTFTKTIGELIEIAINNPASFGITGYEASARLKRLGLKVDVIKDISKVKDSYPGIDFSDHTRKYLYILNTSTWVKQALRGTMFETSPSSVLGRTEGAIKSFPAHFSAGIKGRCVLIPIDKFLNN